MNICVKIYDRDLHQDRHWWGDCRRNSQLMSVTKAQQTECCGCHGPSSTSSSPPIEERALLCLSPLLARSQPWLHILDGKPFFFQNKSFLLKECLMDTLFIVYVCVHVWVPFWVKVYTYCFWEDSYRQDRNYRCSLTYSGIMSWQTHCKLKISSGKRI